MYATKFLARMIVEGNDGSGFAPLFIRGSIPTISPKSHHWYMGVSRIFHWGRDRRAENRGLRPRAGWCSLGEAASPLPTSYGYGSAMSSQRGSWRIPDRPNVFHYFQHSEWPLLTLEYCQLWTIMQPLGTEDHSAPIAYVPALIRKLSGVGIVGVGFNKKLSWCWQKARCV